MKGAGRYREKIKLMRYQSIKQPDLTFVDTWVLLAEKNADRQMERGALENIVGQENIVQPYTFNIRYSKDLELKNGDAVVYRDRMFKIHSFLWNTNRTDLKIFVSTENETTI